MPLRTSVKRANEVLRYCTITHVIIFYALFFTYEFVLFREILKEAESHWEVNENTIYQVENGIPVPSNPFNPTTFVFGELSFIEDKFSNKQSFSASLLAKMLLLFFM